jgi:Cu(I)/Ag(I) efflux system periplasmic protein CusF
MKRMLLWALLVSAGSAFATQPEMADGEVRRINESRREITVAHGPIPHLRMGSMTMAFPVKDPEMLSRVKPGDKVKFLAEQKGDEAVITHIEVVK